MKLHSRVCDILNIEKPIVLAVWGVQVVQLSLLQCPMPGD